jgi:hypothetical protein
MATAYGTQQSVTDEMYQGGADPTSHTEGPVATAIESQTAKLPSDLFLWLALGSIGTSLVLEMSGNREKAHWVGQWVAPFMLFGIYNKLVKIGGTDRLRQ